MKCSGTPSPCVLPDCEAEYLMPTGNALRAALRVSRSEMLAPRAGGVGKTDRCQRVPGKLGKFSRSLKHVILYHIRGAYSFILRQRGRTLWSPSHPTFCDL